MKLILVPYNEEWPREFEAEAMRLRTALGARGRRIDHVGSTSVPGLWAKPVIDIQVSVVGLHPLESYKTALETTGYIHLVHPDDATYPCFYRPAEWPHSHHVHVCEYGSIEERRHLAFRDYLRDHPESAAVYATMKQELAVRFSAESLESRNAYCDAKSDFIEALIEKAFAEGYS